MGWIEEDLQKQKEDIGFIIFWGAWWGRRLENLVLEHFLGDLGAPFGVLRAIL